jgi:hypothetical protein
MRKLIQLLFFLLANVTICHAATTNDAADLTQANNPIANLKAFNIQNYYYPDISGFNTTGDTLWLRYAQPINKFLVRASMPFQTFPVSLNSARQTGSGDFNIFAAYLLDTGNPAVSFGVGPLIVAPTASPSVLGAGKWQGGLASVYFNGNSQKFQFGGLITYQVDFAGNQQRQHTSILAIQPFAFYQLGKGYYLRTAPIWTFNFVADTHVVPLSLGAGKVIKMGKTVYNLFIEPQFSVSHKGIGQPTTQIYAALNLQFYD